MMITKTLALPLAAMALIGAVAACDKVAPAVPAPTPGPIAQSNALDGSYNLRASDCGTEVSKTSLIIDGNRFVYPVANCTVASSEQQVNRTQVTLSCTGGNGPTNRILYLQSRPGVLRVTDDRNTFTYYQCHRDIASSSARVDL